MAVTATISGSRGAPGQSNYFAWEINYDDATRNVTAFASGVGFCVVSLQITANLSQAVSFVPSAGAISQDTSVAAAQVGATEVVADGAVHVVDSNVNPQQVSRYVTRVGGSMGGLPYTAVTAVR